MSDGYTIGDRLGAEALKALAEKLKQDAEDETE